MTFSEAIQRWKGLADIGRKPRTVKYHAEIAGIILDHWLDHEQDVAGIKSAECDDFVLRVAHYSAPRFNAIMLAFRSFVPGASHLKLRRIQIKERAMLEQPAFDRLLAECDRMPKSHAGLAVAFLAHTGLRINEARQLRWDAVKTDGIFVPGSITKNGRPRFIPFVNGIRDTLARLKAVSPGEKVLPDKFFRTGLDKACRRAGVPHLSHHDFRHLFATRCIESGVDMPTVARWLGHSDGGALLGRVYFHLADAHSRKMAALVKI
jgi:integrase